MARNLKGFKSTTELGEFAESRVISEFLRYGYSILKPFGTLRYDLLAQKGEEFLKIQVKHASVRNGAIICKLVSGNGCKNDPYRKYSKKEIDYFAVYVFDIDQVFILPVGLNHIWLRLKPPKNKQRKGIHLAEEYTFQKWVQKKSR